MNRSNTLYKGCVYMCIYVCTYSWLQVAPPWSNLELCRNGWYTVAVAYNIIIKEITESDCVLYIPIIEHI